MLKSIEWSEQNKYNSFSSYKGLSYMGHYQKIVGWLEGQNELPPPIECNLDPIAECNLKCSFCITQRYLRHQRDEVGMIRKLPLDYMLRLVDFLADWGVEALCTSGGGEPTLHDGLPQVIQRAVSRGMKTCVFTNAVHMTPELMEALLLCQWVALSVDAADRETYRQVKGADCFAQATDNIRRLAELRQRKGSSVSLAFKFLFLPENIYSVYEACRLSKRLGVQDFHARPPDLERPDINYPSQKSPVDMRLLQELLELCHAEETSEFRVYTVTHKFDSDLQVVHNFTKCLASPLVIPILTDGNAYLCVDRKMEPSFRLGSCYPNPSSIREWWGSEQHRRLIKSVEISKCSRCTWGEYNRQIEDCVLDDKMCRSFP